MPRSLYRRTRLGLAGLLLGGIAVAQMPSGATPMPSGTSGFDPLRQAVPAVTANQPLFADLDLLRRDEFAHASAAMVSVRVQDGQGNFVPGLGQTVFSLVVNGTSRTLRLRPQGPAALGVHQPVVLLVFPPNQPTVHSIAVKDAIRYFGGQPETMPWKVGIFDANGSFLPFTAERKELLGNLRAVEVAKEPMQFTGYRFLPRGESTWQQKAEEAISNMARSDGPRLIIAVNPLSGSLYGMNETSASAPIARESAQELIGVAARVGAHIYIDNAGGPEVLIPGGSASGSSPSSGVQLAWQQAAALNYFAFTNSQMQQTARETMGGYANELKELAAKMERDLREAYVLEFDMTAQDQDGGVPQVEVSAVRKELRVAMVDVAPLRVSAVADQGLATRKMGAALVLAALRKEMRPMLSPSFRIYQHIDYFPIRSGATPVLPMSAVVEWTGSGPRPAEISIAESVIDMDLSTPALERELDATWQARSVRWERDGELHPGQYVWLVAVHDASGKILSSAKASFTVARPSNASLEVSSLVTGRSCRTEAGGSSLQRRSPPGVRQIVVPLIADPLRTPDCRLIPEPESSFAASEMLRVLVRIYPSGRLAKREPEAWTAHFALTSDRGAVEVTQDAIFAVDSGSGLAAGAVVDLSASGVKSGPHMLELEVRGPGIRGVLKETRELYILPAHPGSTMTSDTGSAP